MRRNWKEEAVKQWEADPCGAVQGEQIGTPAFFRAVEEERYIAYAPWLPEIAGFRRFRGKRLLEVGFGLGTDHIAFARGGARVTGIDLTPAHLWATKRRFEQEQLPVRLTRGDAEVLPFASKSFDAIYSFGVLHHTPETRTAVREIHRVLRPGGEAIVGLYHRDSAFFWQYVLWTGILRGRFFQDGYRRTVSRIERREHSDAMPLVKIYSRKMARALFEDFEDVKIAVHHFAFAHVGRFPWLRRLTNSAIERWMARYFGWYVIIKARKSG